MNKFKYISKKNTVRGSRSVLRWTGVVFFGLLAFVCMIPVVSGLFHVGMWLSFILFACVALLLYRPGWMQKRMENKWFRRLYRLAAFGLSVFCAVTLGLSSAMIYYSNRQAAPDATVIVLGCQIHDDEPGVMLKGRLESAYTYLDKYPDAVCIVSGAQAEDEITSEAAVMKAYLQSRGINPERIFLEERSFNTFENIKYSYEIIEQNGLSKQVAISTDRYHQMRCQLHAQSFGLQTGALSSSSPVGVAVSYWMRDLFGVARLIIFGF